jgi:hypothetical protein
MLRIELPDSKKTYFMYHVPKTFTVRQIKTAFVVMHNLACAESRAPLINMFRKADETFSQPLDNDFTLSQLCLNPDDRLVFNFRPARLDDEQNTGKATPLNWRDRALPYVFWSLILFLVVSVLYVVLVSLKQKNMYADTSIKFNHA